MKRIAFAMRMNEKSYYFTRQIKMGFDFNNQDKYQVDTYSHSGDSESISKIAKKINSRKYDLIIGGETSRTAMILAKMITKTPIISPTATSPRVLDTTSNVFLVSALDSVVYEKLLIYLTDKVKQGKSVCIFHNQSYPNTDYIGKMFADKMKELKPKVCVIKYFNGQKINKEKLNPILINSPDYLVSFTFESELRLIHNILNREKIHPTYIGGDSWGANNLITSTFQKLDKKFKAIKYTYWDEEVCKKEDFRKRCTQFVKEYGENINEYHSIGMDTYTYISNLWDFQKNMPFLRSSNNFLTSKKITPLKNGGVDKSIYFYYFKNGKREIFSI